MSDEDWSHGFAKSLGVFLNGDAIPTLDPRGEPMRDDSFYVLFNAHHEPLPFRLPARPEWGARWKKVLDTDQPVPREEEEIHEAGSEVPVAARGVVVLMRA
jgi:isoamylase